VSIDWATVDGTARAGTDFDGATGRVVITGGPDGTGTGTIAISTRAALRTAAARVEEEPSQTETLGLAVTLAASSPTRSVLGPSEVPVAIERTSAAEPPATTVPPPPPTTVPSEPVPTVPTPPPPVGTPPPTPPVLSPGGPRLPATGGGSTDILLFDAAVLLVLGVLLRSLRRRTVR
jgi:hypothetical protein